MSQGLFPFGGVLRHPIEIINLRSIQSCRVLFKKTNCLITVKTASRSPAQLSNTRFDGEKSDLLLSESCFLELVMDVGTLMPS